MMKDSKRIGFTKWELLVVVLINVALIALLVPAVQQARNPDGPHGKLIPVTAPLEENRVSHGSGISFISPPNWVEVRDMGPETSWLRNTPRGMGRTRAALTISKVGAYNDADIPPDQKKLKEIKQIRFQGYPAYERMINTRKEALDNPYISAYDLYVDRDGEWWHVEYWLSDTLTELPEIMREYINAIRFPPKVDAEKKTESEPGVNE